jgi:hypothetical protein
MNSLCRQEDRARKLNWQFSFLGKHVYMFTIYEIKVDRLSNFVYTHLSEWNNNLLTVSLCRFDCIYCILLVLRHSFDDGFITGKTETTIPLLYHQHLTDCKLLSIDPISLQREKDSVQASHCIRNASEYNSPLDCRSVHLCPSTKIEWRLVTEQSLRSFSFLNFCLLDVAVSTSEVM